MRELFEFAAQVQAFCEERKWRFCFIGGIAVQRWSEPRVTQDVDMTLLTGFGHEEQFIDALLSRFAGRVPNAREFALRQRVVLLISPEQIGIDVALGGLPFEESAVDRATDFEFLPGLRLRTCSAEDLIVFKAFAARPRDWQDVRMTIVRQGEAALDWAYINTQLQPLCELKGQPEIIEQLQELRRELREPPPRRGKKKTSR